MPNELTTFIEYCLPQQGFYIVWSNNLNTERKTNHGFETKLALTQWIEGHQDRLVNLYIAVGAFKDMQGRTIKRTSQNARAFKSLVLDIDVGVNEGGKVKPYATQEEAIIALFNFCELIAIPTPIIISSGWGIHCWWPLQQEVSPQEWFSLQALLANACSQIGLKIDLNVTNRMSVVLRPIGTFNWRKNTEEFKPVRLLSQLYPYVDNNLIKSKLIHYAESTGYKPESITIAQLAHTTSINTNTPALYNLVEERCPQVAALIASDQQQHQTYQQWFALLSVAKHCAYPEETMVRWSSQYPDFDRNAAIEKMNTITYGPALCSSFEEFGVVDSYGQSLCATCVHRQNDKIKTPIQLGVQSVDLSKELDIVTPDNYKITSSGIVKVVEDGVEHFVTPYIMWIDSIYHSAEHGAEHAILKWKDLFKGNIRSMTVPSAKLTTTLPLATFGEMLGVGGITITNGAYEAKEMLTFLANFKQQVIERQKERPNLHASNGYHGENSKYFTLGNTVYNADGDEQNAVSSEIIDVSASSALMHGIGTKGDLQKWIDLTEIFNIKGMEPHGAAFLITYGAVLFHHTGLGGTIIHLNGESGTGKSSIQRFIGSFVGPPQQQLSSAVSTMNAMQRKMATLKNFAALFDEITNVMAKNLSTLIYDSAGGQEKARLTRDLKQREVGVWNTIINTSGNNSIQSKLMSEKVNVRAELLRTIELVIPPTDFFMNINKASEFNSLIDSNYGHAAHRFVQYVLYLQKHYGDNFKNVMLESFQKEFPHFKFNGDERFQMWSIVCCYYGAKIAQQAGLFKARIKPLIEWELAQIEANRMEITNSRATPYDLIGMFLNDSIDGLLVTHEHNSGLVTQVSPRANLVARIEVNTKGNKINQANLYI